MYSRGMISVTIILAVSREILDEEELCREERWRERSVAYVVRRVSLGTFLPPSTRISEQNHRAFKHHPLAQPEFIAAGVNLRRARSLIAPAGELRQ